MICPSDWNLQHGIYCYRAYTNKLTWIQSRNNCGDGYLAKIETQEQFIYLTGQLTGRYWIGGDDRQTGKTQSLNYDKKADGNETKLYKQKCITRKCFLLKIPVF